MSAPAKSRGTTINRLLDGAATLLISEFDAETRFRLRAARGAGQAEQPSLDSVGQATTQGLARNACS
jgi:hypothetical protein